MTTSRLLAVVEPGRVDHFLRAALPHLSQRTLREILGEGRVRLNGRRARKGDRVGPGDVVAIDAAWCDTTTLRGQPDLGIPILAECAEWVALDKPAGTPSVAQRLVDLGTVSNFLAGRFPESAAVAARNLECGVVHRLDTATSGVLLAARSAKAYRALRAQFATHAVTKTYRVLVDGQVGGPGCVTASIRTVPGDPTRVEIVPDAARGARPAETSFRPIAAGAEFSELEVEIRSGVRHQIRLHLASIGHAVVGDELYGRGGGARLFLHAQTVAFSDPSTGRPTSVSAPLPAQFAHAEPRSGSAFD